MTRFLLDVNVLIALIDPAHVQHDTAHAWFAKSGHKAWATCPLTQNGVVRIVGHPRYPNSPGTPADVAKLLHVFVADTGHEFWPDSVSLLSSAQVRVERLMNSAQITDSYLLALSVAHGGKLVNLDRRVVTDAVVHGSQALHVIQ